MYSYTINLPFPVSTNRIWRQGKGRTYLSPEYEAWIKQADALYLTQTRKLHVVTLGRYHADLVFDEKQRGAKDADNLIKCVNDWLQRVDIVHNDKMCYGGKWSWGEAPSGCIVIVTGEKYEGRVHAKSV